MSAVDQTPVHEIRPVTQDIPERFIPVPTVEPGHTFASVTDHISAIVLQKRMPKLWWLGLAVGIVGVTVLTATLGKLVLVGVGIFGITSTPRVQVTSPMRSKNHTTERSRLRATSHPA